MLLLQVGKLNHHHHSQRATATKRSLADLYQTSRTLPFRDSTCIRIARFRWQANTGNKATCLPGLLDHEMDWDNSRGSIVRNTCARVTAAFVYAAFLLRNKKIGWEWFGCCYWWWWWWCCAIAHAAARFDLCLRATTAAKQTHLTAFSQSRQRQTVKPHATSEMRDGEWERVVCSVALAGE